MYYLFLLTYITVYVLWYIKCFIKHKECFVVEDLWSAGQIVKRLKGVTTRQILDLAEKGIIVPARDTTGPGSARLYNFQNIFEICVCLALRGRLPGHGDTADNISHILRVIREISSEAEKGDIPSFDLLYISYDDKNNYSLMPITFHRSMEPLQVALEKASKKYRPQNFCTYLLEISALRSFLKILF